jgi:protein-disulfide isomerase/predicted transcriptional regulator
VLLAALALAPGCKRERPAGQGGGPAGEPAPDAVVATLGGRPVTLAEVDRGVRTELERLEEEYGRERLRVRRQALDALLERRLLQEEAQRRGLVQTEGAARGQPDVDALWRAEVRDKLTPPGEEELQRAWRDTAAQAPAGARLDDYRAQLVEFLQREQERQLGREFLARLRAEGGVKVLLREARREVEPRGPARGPSDAPVTVVAFSDFECPFCARARPVLDALLETYPGQVRLVFRHFPLPFHPHAARAAEASLCADAQGRFWPYHDALFDDPKSLSEEGLRAQARAVGLDEAEFAACLSAGRFAAQVREDVEAARRLGVDGAPALFVNGRPLPPGVVSAEELRAAVEEELPGARR